MTKTIVLPGLLALGFSLCLVAQNEADYSGWMKDVAATRGKVTKGIAAKQNADVATDAAHLADLFKQVGAFWTGRKVSDAETFAKNAETAANDLAAAAKGGEEAKIGGLAESAPAA
jgi:hypothetical protein